MQLHEGFEPIVVKTFYIPAYNAHVPANTLLLSAGGWPYYILSQTSNGGQMKKRLVWVNLKNFKLHWPIINFISKSKYFRVENVIKSKPK